MRKLAIGGVEFIVGITDSRVILQWDLHICRGLVPELHMDPKIH